jgi:regulator of PEP synthase PpsR (kinase-PPPase family)
MSAWSKVKRLLGVAPHTEAVKISPERLEEIRQERLLAKHEGLREKLALMEELKARRAARKLE